MRSYYARATLGLRPGYARGEVANYCTVTVEMMDTFCFEFRVFSVLRWMQTSQSCAKEYSYYVIT